MEKSKIFSIALIVLVVLVAATNTIYTQTLRLGGGFDGKVQEIGTQSSWPWDHQESFHRFQCYCGRQHLVPHSIHYYETFAEFKDRYSEIDDARGFAYKNYDRIPLDIIDEQSWNLLINDLKAEVLYREAYRLHSYNPTDTFNRRSFSVSFDYDLFEKIWWCKYEDAPCEPLEDWTFEKRSKNVIIYRYFEGRIIHCIFGEYGNLYSLPEWYRDEIKLQITKVDDLNYIFTILHFDGSRPTSYMLRKKKPEPNPSS